MGVLLISEVKLKAFTNINKNVDIDVLKAEIQIAQDIDLQTILGTKFYDHLLNQVSSTGNTFNNDEKTLVDDYIQPFLIQQAYFQAMPNLQFRTMNRGIVEGQMENATSVDLDTFKYLRNIQKSRADFYMNRLMDYLLIGKGQNKFPQYTTQSTIDGMIPDRTQKYNPGIFLRHTTRKGYSKRDRWFTNGGIPMYSELAHENPPCQDCY
jgi:hypothetical protein